LARGTVGKETTRAEFLKSELARDAELSIENGKYRPYRLARPQLIDERDFAVDLYFEDERLSAIDLALLDPQFGASWDDWSEASEKQRLAAHNEWLRAFLDGNGPQWTFSWGTIESSFDPRGGGSSIRIGYR
jgi:hypothetical protein